MTRSGPSHTDHGGGPDTSPPRIIAALVHSLDISGRLVCAVSLTVLFAGLLANVILRYAYGAGLQWAYEIHAILLPWLVAGGLILATVRNRNIAVTILPDMLGPVAGRLVLILVLALTLVISAVVVWSSFPIMRAAQFQRIASLGGVSQLWGYASLVYGFVGVALICACDIVTLLMGRLPGRGAAASSLS